MTSPLPGPLIVTGSSVSTTDTAPAGSSSQALQTDDLWEKAHNNLSEKDKETIAQVLTTQNPSSSSLNTPITEIILQDLKAKRQDCRPGWTVKIGKTQVNVRAVADKLIDWLDKFKSIGDVAVSVDPLHAAPPWVAIRFVLGAAVAGKDQMAALLSGLNRVLYVMYRCRLYELLFQPAGKGISSDAKLQLALGNFRTSLLDLYKLILHFLATALRVCQKSRIKQTLDAFWSPGDIQTFEEDCQAIEDRVEKECQNCERYLQGQERTESSRYRAILNGLPQLKELKSSIDHTDNTVTEVWEILQGNMVFKILTWISKLPYEDYHKFARTDRTPDTGDWIVGHWNFQQWKSSEKSTILWLHGIPGAGKTKLVSKVIDHFKDQHSDYGLAYFYCSRDDDDRRDSGNILRSFVKQLCKRSQNNAFHKVILQAHQEYRSSGGASVHMNFDESKEILSQLSHGYPKMVMILDALDESFAKSRDDLIEAFNWLATRSDNVKVFVSSRRDDDIKWQLEHKSNIGISATDNQRDIRKFVNEKIENGQKAQRRRPFSAELKRDIVTTLYKKSDGMFQWVALQIEQILGLKLEVDIRQRLGKLPKGLEEAYDEIFTKIQSAEGSYPEIAHRAFLWILYSPTPLEPEALSGLIGRSLCAGKDATPDLDFDTIIDACGNLLVLRRGECRFSHLSVQEYIEERKDCQNSLSAVEPACAKLAMTAIMSLSDLCAVIETWEISNPGTRVAKNIAPPELRHTMKYWPFYTKRALENNSSKQLELMLLDLFSITNTKVFKFWLRAILPLQQFAFTPEYIRQINVANKEVEGQKFAPTVLYCAAALGLKIVVAKLLSEGANLTEDGSMESPIIAAARSGCPETVSLFLDSDPAIPGSLIFQSISATAEKEVALVLLRYGLRAQSCDDSSFHSLCFMAATESTYGDLAMEFLLAEFPEVSITETMLQKAVKSPLLSDSIVGLLLDQNLNISITESTFQEIAARFPTGSWVDHYLETYGRNIDVVLSDKSSMFKDHQSVYQRVQLILEKRPEIPINAATFHAVMAQEPSAELISLLLEKMPVTVITEATLMTAAGKKNHELLPLLLEKRPDLPLSEAIVKATAANLTHAAKSLPLLLGKMPDLIINEAILVAAAANTHLADKLMPCLLERQPDIPISEATLETAAMNPCDGRAENLIQLLLAKKPDLNISDHLIKSMLSGSNTASAFYLLMKGRPATIVTEDLFDLAAKNETNALLFMFILLEHNPDFLPNKAVLLNAVLQNKSLGGQWWDILYDRWPNHRLAEDFLQAVIDETRNGILMMCFFPSNQHTTEAKIQAAAKSALEWEGNLVKEKKENPNWEVDMAYPRKISPDPLQCDNDPECC